MPLGSAFTPTCNISSALAALKIRAKFAELCSIFSYKNQKLVMKPLNLRADGGKTPKTTPQQQCPWQVPSGPHATFFSPSPANEEKFAESAFFHTKIKNLSWNRWIYEPMGAKHKKLLVGNNAPGKCLHAHMQHFFCPSRAIEKKFAESAFFHTKIKNLSWNHWIYEPMGENTENYSSATMPQASAFTPTCNISSALALLMRKNSLSQHFFIQKPNTCHETVEFTSQSRQNTKNNSWATMPLATAFRPTCNLPSALAPLGRKNSLSQHFFTQKSKTCQETIEFTSRWGKHRKLLLGNNATRKCLHAHMQHFFSPSSANEEKFAESAFFHTKIKNLSWNHWIYEPMGAKHKKLLVGNNAPGKCLHVHMQHFFCPSPAMEKKFAESAFLHTKIKNL